MPAMAINLYWLQWHWQCGLWLNFPSRAVYALLEQPLCLGQREKFTLKSIGQKTMSADKRPAERLLERIVPLMEREGYVYRKSNHRFLKAFPCGKYEYSLTFDGRAGLVGVDAGFFVHFDALQKQFKKVLGYECGWSAGATLLNARADPWKFWLNDERFATMSPHELAAVPSDVVHPPSRIDAAVQFLADAHTRHAVPFFQKLQTYRDLADFYREYRCNGYTGYCRPMPENVVYLSLFVAASLGDDLDEIVASAQGMKSHIAGQDVDAVAQKVLAHIAAIDRSNLLA